MHGPPTTIAPGSDADLYFRLVQVARNRESGIGNRDVVKNGKSIRVDSQYSRRLASQVVDLLRQSAVPRRRSAVPRRRSACSYADRNSATCLRSSSTSSRNFFTISSSAATRSASGACFEGNNSLPSGSPASRCAYRVSFWPGRRASLTTTGCGSRITSASSAASSPLASSPGMSRAARVLNSACVCGPRKASALSNASSAREYSPASASRC